MKKLLSILLATMLAAGLAACSSGDNSSKGGEGSSQTSSETGESKTPPVVKEGDPKSFAQEFEDLYAGKGDFADLPVLVMDTSMGEVQIRLFPRQAPKTVENIIGLAKKGYYDGLTFHRVIDGFMIQGGDPTGTGAGGESLDGKEFDDEFNDLLHNFRGSLSMANRGYGTNSSQFFIVQAKEALTLPNGAPDALEPKEYHLMNLYMNRSLYNASMELEAARRGGKSDEELQKLTDELNEQLSAKQEAGVPEDYRKMMEPVLKKYEKEGGSPSLDYKHTVFGHVIKGMDVVDAIAAVETDPSNDKPVKDVTINKMTVKE